MKRLMKLLFTTRPMWLLWLLLLTFGCCCQAEAKFSKYTRERPLVIVCDWDLPPYEFLDDHGTPNGYTIELLGTILKQMKIPYTFVMNENPQVEGFFKKHQADLFVAPTRMVKADSCYVSTNVLNYYKTKIVSRDTDAVVHSVRDIPYDKVVVLRKNGQLAEQVVAETNPRLQVKYHAPMEALSGVRSGKYDYFIWGEEPLKWKIKELNLDSLRISELDVPIIEIHIIGYDKELIDAIDDQYARIEQSGELKYIRDKWFHPERHHDNASPVFLYGVIAVLALLLLLFLINQFISRKVKRQTLRNSEQTRLMNLALDLGGYMVAEYDARKDRFRNLRGKLMDEKQTMADAFDTIHDDDRETFRQKVKELQDNATESSIVFLRRKEKNAGNGQWQYLTGNCIKERDEDNRLNYLLIGKDITKEMEEQHSNNELAAKYNKAFDVSLGAMAFYDKDGHLLEMNEKMKAVVGADETNQNYFYETLLFDAPLFRSVLYPGMREVTHACQHMYYPELGLDKYLEYRIRPVLDEEDEIRYYAVTVRDITDERNLYREQQATERQLMVTNAEVSKFELQLNHLLSSCNMFIWHSNYKNATIEVSRSLHREGTAFSFDEYLGGVSKDDYDEAFATLFNPLMRNKPINIVRHFRKSPLIGAECWYAISGTPLYDKNGKTEGHFGVIRDVTKLMISQEELRRETLRAQQSGTLKATFLANMTHEIRTPLNAIVGFSDLLHMAGTTEERTEFIHIIRHNCDLLMRLIDDLLETSDMNENPQNIEPEDVDFSTFFDEVCQTLAQRVQEPGVLFIKDNPYDSFPVRTDRERVQQVITNFVTNAVKYTHEGHIKVGYRSEDDGIYIYCEDTGAGIPPEKQASVFDRFVKLDDFVQGTGLGLAICKSIADRCNGRIGVVSEGAGKGSTFWLWIPRNLTSSNFTGEK